MSKNERRILASHPDYEEINRLNLMRSILLNPNVHWNTHDQNMSELDRTVLLSDIDSAIDEVLDGGIFRDFLT